MDEQELAAILTKLKRTAPDMYRHIVGVIKAYLGIIAK
jgi:hypothetical protein